MGPPGEPGRAEGPTDPRRCLLCFPRRWGRRGGAARSRDRAAGRSGGSCPRRAGLRGSCGQRGRPGAIPIPLGSCPTGGDGQSPPPAGPSPLLSPARRSPSAWQPRRPPQPVFQPCASSAVTASCCGALFAVQLISELERGETSPPEESGLAGGRAGGRGEHSCAAGPRRAPLPPPPARRCRGLALGSWKELVGVCTLSSRRGGSRGWELVRAPGAAGGWRGGCGPSWELCSCSRGRPPSASSTIATRSWCRPCSACRASAPTSPASTASAAASRAGTSTCWSSATTRASTSPVSTGVRGRRPREELARSLPRGTVGALGGGYLPFQAGILAQVPGGAVSAGTPQPAQGRSRPARTHAPCRALCLRELQRGPGAYFGRSSEFSAQANARTQASPPQHSACPTTLSLPKQCCPGEESSIHPLPCAAG